MGSLGLFEIWRFAWAGISSNRMRSALTILGVLIGVSSVIILTAVGNGSATAVRQQIEKLGTNSITVLGPGFKDKFSKNKSSLIRDLTIADAIALNDRERAPNIKHAAPIVNATISCTYGNYGASPQSAKGSWPSYFEASNSPVSKGGYWTNDDVLKKRGVAVIGTTLATNLFDTSNPIGKKIRCSGQTVTVIGVLKPKGSIGFQDADDVIIMPITFVQRAITGYGKINQIQVQSINAESSQRAIQEVTSIMDAQHKIKSTAMADYRVLNQSELLESSSDSSKTLTVLLAAIAAISLLVGGIGITNIMLVSVTERTREIGILKAIGAPKAAILTQFLIEATMLSLIGGALGVLIGVGLTQFSILGVIPVVTLSSVMTAFIVSALIGLIFGGWPANRAASLKPIDAIRHE